MCFRVEIPKAGFWGQRVASPAMGQLTHLNLEVPEESFYWSKSQPSHQVQLWSSSADIYTYLCEC